MDYMCYLLSQLQIGVLWELSLGGILECGLRSSWTLCAPREFHPCLQVGARTQGKLELSF